MSMSRLDHANFGAERGAREVKKVIQYPRRAVGGANYLGGYFRALSVIDIRAKDHLRANCSRADGVPEVVS